MRAVVVGSAAACAGVALVMAHLATSAHRDGPLAGYSDVSIVVNQDADAKGFAFANQVLTNPGTTPITLEAVEPKVGEGDLRLAHSPYLWGPERVAASGNGVLVGWALPLPGEWAGLKRVPVAGAVVAAGDVDPGLELVMEFEPVSQVSVLRGVTVTYSVGGKTRTEFLGSGMTICPASHQGDCPDLVANG